MFHFYRPQRSCGQGYVFTRVCDSVHRGGLQAGRTPPPRRRTPQAGRTPPRQGGPPSREEPPSPDQADTPPDQAEPPPRTRQTTPPPPEADSRIRSTSGRYASYWNAFLFVANVIFFSGGDYMFYCETVFGSQDQEVNVISATEKCNFLPKCNIRCLISVFSLRVWCHSPIRASN